MLQRIKNMRSDVFPLDLMLSKTAVLSIFLEKYNSENNKALFIKNNPPMNKRLREGYWSLFACVALDILEQRNHVILFPSNPSNDIYFISENDMDAVRPKVNGIPLDVKEYTTFSSPEGFNAFVSRTINKNRELYAQIIGVHEDIVELDLSSLFYKGKDRGVFIIGSDNQDDSTVLVARVIFIRNDQVLFDQNIDLSSLLKKPNRPVIFHDTVRGLP